jgi:hypothetical protein
MRSIKPLLLTRCAGSRARSFGLNMETAAILTRLWDYGWLCRDSVKLAAESSDAALIERYFASPAFHTSFLPNHKDETGIHGPFVAERITATDFVPLQEAELGLYLESVQVSDTPAEDVAARAKMLPYLRAAFEGGRRCYVLSRNERNRELFHEWGFVLFVFREFLFVGAARDCVERFVIGYD